MNSTRRLFYKHYVPPALLLTPFKAIAYWQYLVDARVDRGEYTKTYLNGRLIDCGKSVLRLENVAFTTPRVKLLDRMVIVDLFSQPVHVNLDRV